MNKSQNELDQLKQEIDHAKSNRLLRIRDVIEITGLSKSYIYQLAANNQFPKSVQIVKDGVSVAWLEQEIIDWVQSRVNDRDGVTI